LSTLLLSLLGLLLLLRLVLLHCSHPQLCDILLSGQAELLGISSELFALLLGELFGRHPSFGGFGGELLLHGRHLLGARAGRGHNE
jgi:hypothetical protein